AVGGLRKEIVGGSLVGPLLNPRQRVVGDGGAGLERRLKQREPALGMGGGAIRVDESNAVARSHDVVGNRLRRVLADPFERSTRGAGVTEIVAHQPLDLLAR